MRIKIVKHGIRYKKAEERNLMGWAVRWVTQIAAIICLTLSNFVRHALHINTVI